MDLISSCVGKRIIDVGAGVTTLVEDLIENHFDVTVLDISSQSLEILSERHGDDLAYILGDLSQSLDLGEYEIWHDRAVLHFLLSDTEKETYVSNLESCIPSGGYAVIETFSTDGAPMCCGLNLHRYDEKLLESLLGENWSLVESRRHIHINPFGDSRPYISTIFKRN